MIELDFMLTGRCNALCPICFTESDKKCGTQLSESDIVEFVKRTSNQCNDVEVHFTGGEPCCFPGFYELLRKIDSIGIRYQFVTNGTLLDTQKVLGLMNLNKIVFSLYGEEAFHDRFVGIDGAFGRIANAIQHLSTEGIGIQVNITCCDINIQEIKRLLHNKVFLYVDSIKLYPVLRKGRAITNCIGVTTHRYKELVEYAETIGIEKLHYYDGDNSIKEVYCPNELSLFINEKGGVFPCLALAHDFCRVGSIKDESSNIEGMLETAKYYRCTEGCKCTKSLI